MGNHLQGGETLNLSEIEDAISFFEELYETVSPYLEWAKENWLTLVLSGEIVGAVLAVKMGSYRRGLAWLGAALATIWIGGSA